jgi:hypothetical protein
MIVRGCPAGLAEKLDTPRSLALAALRWSRVVFSDHAAAIRTVAQAARGASARRTAWLPPVDLRLTDAAALRCQCSAAVEPESAGKGAALSLIVAATVVAVSGAAVTSPRRLPVVGPPGAGVACAVSGDERPMRPPSPLNDSVLP